MMDGAARASGPQSRLQHDDVSIVDEHSQPTMTRKRTAGTVLTNEGYLFGSKMRHGNSSLTRFIGQ